MRTYHEAVSHLHRNPKDRIQLAAHLLIDSDVKEIVDFASTVHTNVAFSFGKPEFLEPHFILRTTRDALSFLFQTTPATVSCAGAGGGRSKPKLSPVRKAQRRSKSQSSSSSAHSSAAKASDTTSSSCADSDKKTSSEEKSESGSAAEVDEDTDEDDDDDVGEQDLNLLEKRTKGSTKSKPAPKPQTKAGWRNRHPVSSTRDFLAEHQSAEDPLPALVDDIMQLTRSSKSNMPSKRPDPKGRKRKWPSRKTKEAQRKLSHEAQLQAIYSMTIWKRYVSRTKTLRLMKLKKEWSSLL